MIDKNLSAQLDKRANGSDEAELNGKKYIRSGPKNSVSQPGPWRELKESQMDLLRELISLNIDPAIAIPVSEAVKSNHYLDSGEFTDDFYKIDSLIKGIKEITDSPKWTVWLKDTDKNFGTKCTAQGEKMAAALKKFDLEHAKLEKELDKAE